MSEWYDKKFLFIFQWCSAWPWLSWSQRMKRTVCISALMIAWVSLHRGSWQLRESYCSRTRSSWQSRTLAFCLAVKSAECSSSNRSSSSVSCFGKARQHQGTSLKRALRYIQHKLDSSSIKNKIHNVCMLTSCVQVSYLSMEEHVESDPCKFVLLCRGSSERLTLQAANIDIKKEWVQSIRVLLDMQINFLTGERIMKGLRKKVVVGLYTNRSQCCLIHYTHFYFIAVCGIIDNLLLVCFWSALQNPQEYQKKESGGSLSRQLSNSSRSSSSHPSTPLKPNTAPNGSPAHKPNTHVEEVSMIQNITYISH